MNRFRRLLLLLGSVCLLCALAPLPFGVFNAGNYLLLCLGFLLLILKRLWPRLDGHRVVRGFLLVGMWTGISAIALISGLIAWRAWLCAPQEEGRQTLIVLGAHVFDTGPSRMLRYRPDKAYDYLVENPEAVCVVTGGQGANEPRTEASVMAEYLYGRGIPTERTLLEEASTNTDENIRFSLALIPGDSQGIVIVTNDFHQMRAYMLAVKYGLETRAMSCFTPPALLPAYWMREVGGVPYTWIMELLGQK